MTRINVGVPPSELCDQHLIAEYHELPRVWKFAETTAWHPRPDAPKHFCLGRGHVLWCAQYPGMLYLRFRSLVREMRARGFAVRHPEPPSWAGNGMSPTPKEIDHAGIIVRARLEERLATMKNPRWTKPPTSATATAEPESSAPAA